MRVCPRLPSGWFSPWSAAATDGVGQSFSILSTASGRLGPAFGRLRSRSIASGLRRDMFSSVTFGVGHMSACADFSPPSSICFTWYSTDACPSLTLWPHLDSALGVLHDFA